MSSRNQRLSDKQKNDAAIFFRALSLAAKELRSGKEISEVKSTVRTMINSINGVVLEYFEVADSKNLNPISNVSQSAAPVLCIAGFVGEVRLIDNVLC